MIDETTPGREPVTILQIDQPFCSRTYSKGRCRAGSGVLDKIFTTGWSAGTVEGWTGLRSTITTITGGGVNIAFTAANPAIVSPVDATGFDGNSFRYVVLRGKLNSTTLGFVCDYESSAGTFATVRSMGAVNDADLTALASGSDFVAVFDASDSTNYAIDWQGDFITRLKFTFNNVSDVDLYSIEVTTKSPIDAIGSECFNTFATCQDTPNYLLGPALKLYFSDGGELTGADTSLYVIPSLKNVSTQPVKINLTGADVSASGLGTRAVVNASFTDHPHTDRVVDPYLSTRPYTPMDQGSFWSKWFVRNIYRQDILMTVYNGYVGQLLSAMVTRKYFMHKVTGPDSNGAVSINGKDILARLEARKAQAPHASPGVLFTAIDNSQLSFEVAGAAIADYDASGTIVISDEVMTYSAVATSSNGITFTIAARGADGTTATTHSASDTVQLCLRYTNAKIADLMLDLLQNYGNIPLAYLNKAGWDTELDQFLASYRLNALIVKPTDVNKLVSSLQIECQFYAWWDERQALVQVKSIRGIDAVLPVLTEADNIVAGSFKIKEAPEKRASQVWVFHTVRNPTKSQTDISRYRTTDIVADLASEGPNQFGGPSVKKIFSRFLSSTALASTTATRIVNANKIPPREATFEVDAKDRATWVGDQIQISHHLDVDNFGANRAGAWTIVSADEFVPGHSVRYTVVDTSSFGKINFVMAGGAADYPGPALAPFKNFYIGDKNGLLSDGTEAAKIA